MLGYSSIVVQVIHIYLYTDLYIDLDIDLDIELTYSACITVHAQIEIGLYKYTVLYVERLLVLFE